MLRLLLPLLALAQISLGMHVKHDNLGPFTSPEGEVLDAHDGNMLEVDGTYYLYAMGYTDCKLETGLIPPRDCPGIYRKFGSGCGFRTDHALNIYTSTDLSSWTIAEPTLASAGLPLETRPEGIYFRPKVVWNELTQLYVLWINYLPPDRTPLKAYPVRTLTHVPNHATLAAHSARTQKATYLVGTSESPLGPFELLDTEPNLKYEGAGDLTIAVDEATGNAYVAYDAWSNSHTLSVELLDPTFTFSTQENSGLLSPSSHEAPLLFKR
jgi:hypothetical protein